MASLVQRSLAGGELAPAMYARADLVKYQTGLRTCRNFVILRHGGASNRAGTEYIVTTKTLGRRILFIPFIFNADQTYVLEFGHFYMRIVRFGVQLTVSGVSAWSNATAYVVGDLAVDGGVNYYCIEDHTNHQPPNATYWYALTGDIYEVPTPYDEANLYDDNGEPLLAYAQSGDIITLTHPSYPSAELRRSGHTKWTLIDVSAAPSISAPAPSLTVGGAGSNSYYYAVTAIKSETYEESLPGTDNDTSAAAPTEAAPHALSWMAVTGAAAYNVYKGTSDGALGFISQVTGTAYNDTGLIEPDYTHGPPVARDPFSGSNYPATTTHFQQRRWFAGPDANPETAYGTKTGAYSNFSISYPLQEDDAVTFTLAGKQVNAIRHLLEVDERFIALTGGSEWVIKGDVDGTVTPTAPNTRQFGSNGSSRVRPAIVDNSAIYVQARGNRIRDLRYNVTNEGSGYLGRDLSVFADHLFKGKTIVDMAYQQIPESVIWCVRSDGVLIGLTYLRDHEVWGWHRHDTDGYFENVTVVPEGDEDVLYACVRRTIGGIDYRYIERMHTRLVTDIAVDAFFVDSGLTYDGRNTGATTMTLSGGTDWGHTEVLTITASASFFVSGDVGNAIVMRSGDDEIEVTILEYTSGTVVTGSANMIVPTTLRDTAVTDWGKAVDQISGLGHLEGKTVYILADGVPETPQVVTSAALPNALSKPAEIIHIGLQIVADLETLDLEILNGQTLADKKKRINCITVFTEESRGLKAGDSANNLKELPVKNSVYEDPSAVEDEKVEIIPRASWNNHGRVFIRQDEPLPLTVLSIVPSGFIGG